MQPDTSNLPGRYLKIHAVAFVAVALAISLMAFAVDPWGIWHDVRIAGFNQYKFAAWRYQQLHKAGAVACRKPGIVIAGTSRALALQPSHPALAGPGHAAYNLAINGGRIQDVRRYLDLAYAVGPVSDVVIGLDFFMFSGNPRSRKPRDLARLAWFSKHPGCLPNPEDWLPTLFSQDAIRATRRSLSRQRQPDRSSFTLPDGTWGALELLADIEKRGQRRLFRNTEAAMKTSVYSSVISDPRVDAGLVTLAAIFENAKRNGTRIHVMVSPIHARLSEVIYRLDLWDELEDWKRGLIEVAEAAGVPPILDFGGYNEITTESVPGEQDIGVAMRWWWDPSHYSPATGDLILDRLFGSPHPERRSPAGFGVPLEQSGIEAHFAATRAARERYTATHAKDLEDLGGKRSE